MAFLEEIEGVTDKNLVLPSSVNVRKEYITIPAAFVKLEPGAVLTMQGQLVGVEKVAEGLEPEELKAEQKRLVARYILAEAVNPGETVATVYTSGEFNAALCYVANIDTLERHETELRKAGIYLARKV